MKKMRRLSPKEIYLRAVHDGLWKDGRFSPGKPG